MFIIVWSLSDLKKLGDAHQGSIRRRGVVSLHRACNYQISSVCMVLTWCYATQSVNALPGYGLGQMSQGVAKPLAQLWG